MSVKTYTTEVLITGVSKHVKTSDKASIDNALALLTMTADAFTDSSSEFKAQALTAEILIDVTSATKCSSIFFPNLVFAMLFAIAL